MGPADQIVRPQCLGQRAAKRRQAHQGLLNHSSRHSRERWLAPANPITRSSSPFSSSPLIVAVRQLAHTSRRQWGASCTMRSTSVGTRPCSTDPGWRCETPAGRWRDRSPWPAAAPAPTWPAPGVPVPPAPWPASVGIISRRLITNRGHPAHCAAARAWLTVDWERCNRSAAQVTLRSCISMSNTVSRLRSRRERAVPSILTIVE